MTEKELLYFEDAIGHEKSIIKICDFMLQNLNDETLKTFMENERNEHTNLKEKLMNLLKENSNE